MSGYFEGCEFRHVPRDQNDAADTLSKLGSSRESVPPSISLEHLRKPSIKPSRESSSIYVPPSLEEAVPMEIDADASLDNPGTALSVPGTGPTYAVTAVFRSRSKGKGKMYQEVVPAYPGTALAYPGTALSVPGTLQPMDIDYVSVEVMEIDQAVFTAREVPSWARPIMDFMVNGQLPVDEAEAHRIMRRSKTYTIINKEIYKRSATGVLQRCVESAEGQEMLREIHQGECGHHASSRALVSKAFRHGFYWPTALQEAEDLVRKCNRCQRYAHQIHQPASALKTIPLTWPFAIWGLDMVEAYKPTRGKMTHILVMVDKFTKWIEVKPISKCDGHTTVKFLKDIILRYGVPHSIITDNGSNFAQGPFARYCEEVGIRLDIASVAHPCTNGQVERSNGLVLSGIKPRLIEPLEKTPGCWLDELPAVLWSLRTTPNRSTGYTPFFLVYGAEAVLPTDVIHDAPRVVLYTEEEAKEAREDDVDLLEEAREITLSRTAVYQQNLRRYHAQKVNPRRFQEGDLVLRLRQGTAGRHKLTPPWEGPFIVSKALHNDSYYIIDAQAPN
jgi:hypothetical protein